MNDETYQKVNDIVNVSRETFAKLSDYVDLLLRWNARINLIGRATEEDIWNRHVIDCLQLFKYIPHDKKTLMDLGSGAGLPGIVLAICGQELSSLEEIYLVESNKKKCSFLQQASLLSPLNVKICNERIEALNGIKPQIFTARALASLKDLFFLTEKIVDKNSFFIFQKGINVVEEIEEATKYCDFDVENYDSRVAKGSKILICTNVKIKR